MTEVILAALRLLFVIGGTAYGCRAVILYGRGSDWQFQAFMALFLMSAA